MDIGTAANERAGTTSPIPVISWDWYRDPRVLEVEERRLFRSSWQYVGPLECLSRAGDHVVGRVSRVPVVVVRGGDGELRGFLNVCRHRGSLVVLADGNTPRLQCPYHAWTYNLDGTLRSAPQCGPEIAAELPALGLVPARVATFGPFVFVNFPQMPRRSTPSSATWARSSPESASTSAGYAAGSDSTTDWRRTGRFTSRTTSSATTARSHTRASHR